MQIPLIQIDAFAESLFEGNPAAVMPLEDWLEDEVLQQIAEENKLSETAFFTELPDGMVAPTDDPAFLLRWFTPSMEVTLCGHATLATGAYVLDDVVPDAERVWFHSLSGWLGVTRAGDRRLTLDFPADHLEPIGVDPALEQTLGVRLAEVYQSLDLVCVVESPEAVRDLSPDLTRLSQLDQRGVIVTAAGSPEGMERFDFVSRWFGAGAGIAEDPVTGSAHTQIAPYWADRLGRTTLRARQLSARGGTLDCVVDGDRVRLTGAYRRYLEGQVTL